MRRIFIIAILILSYFLCACHRNINTVDEFECVTTAPIIEAESRTKDDNYIEAEKIYVQDDIEYLMVDVQKINLGAEGKIHSAQIVDNYIIWQSYDAKWENTDRNITFCIPQEDGSINIMAYDLNGNLINTYMVNDYIVSANCNSKCAVWNADEGLLVYDFERDSIISLDISSFSVLVDDCVIISADDGQLLAQWYIPGQYNGYSWLENEVTILQISIDSID